MQMINKGLKVLKGSEYNFVVKLLILSEKML